MKFKDKLTRRRSLVASGLLVGAASVLAQDKDSQDSETPVRVAYHIDDSARATLLLRNVANHLDADPNAQIIVVANAGGITFMQNGAKDEKNPNIDYAAMVGALVGRGVHFEVCENTINSRKLKKDDFIMDAEFTPSGVARLGQLQAREGYGYIKP